MERIEIQEQIKPIIQDSKKNTCIENGVLNKQIKISGRIGTDSRIASVYKACFPLNCKYYVAVKKVPLKEIDIKYLKETNSLKALNESFLWRELYILKMCNLLVQQNICPNLPLLYSYFKCDKCVFDNVKVKKSTFKCVTIVNELASGDLKQLLVSQTDILSVKELLIIFYQIYFGIYCIKKYYGIFHQDLHWGNVLYHKVPKKNNYIQYNIGNHRIVLPNVGFLMVLWDFEFSRIKDKIEPKGISNDHPDDDFEDYRRVTSMLNLDEEQKNTEYAYIGEFLQNILKKFSNTVSFMMLFGDYLTDTYSSESSPEKIINIYDSNKKLKLNKENIDISRFI